MKKYILGIMIAVTAFSLVLTSAEAKRLGGGGSSFGKQSQNVTRQAPMQSNQAAAPAKPAAAPATAPAAKPASPWKGILGGALLGLGLGALFSSLGIGGAMANILSTMLMVGLLALAAMFIYRMIRSRKGGDSAPSPFANAYSGAAAGGAGQTPEIGSRVEPFAHPQPAALQSVPQASGSFEPAAATTWGIPADFDVPAFLRHAKTYYIRLQAAWDKGDTNDIREFTTPEMFGELKLQLQERGATPNQTDVVTLDAELMGIETVGQDYLASVKFSGMIKEAEHAPAEPFAEVWNLSKPVNGTGGWVLAGIQQLS
jgi:predicted lipid-binding transport protein (Tim44 family)